MRSCSAARGLHARRSPTATGAATAGTHRWERAPYLHSAARRCPDAIIVQAPRWCTPPPCCREPHTRQRCHFAVSWRRSAPCCRPPHHGRGRCSGLVYDNAERQLPVLEMGQAARVALDFHRRGPEAARLRACHAARLRRCGTRLARCSERRRTRRRAARSPT